VNRKAPELKVEGDSKITGQDPIPIYGPEIKLGVSIR